MHCNKIQASTFSLRFTQFILAVVLSAAALPAISAEKPYCRWGDCEDGIGEKVYPAESGEDLSYIAKFADGRARGYAIKLRKGSNWICETSYRSDGRRFGIEFCATERGSRTYKYLDPKGIVKGSDYIWVSNAGKVVVGRWFSSNNIWPVPVALEKIYQDHSALRRRGNLTQFLPDWFPDLIRDEKFLTEQEMMAAIEKNKEAEQNKNQKAKKTVAKEKKKNTGASEVKDKYFINTNVSNGCYFGDCEDGFGGYLSKNGDLHVGLWKKSKPHGYGLFTEAKSQSECEAVYKDGKVNSLQVCIYPKSNQAGAYQRGQVNRPREGIRWNLGSGEIIEVGIWKGDKIYREDRIDLSLVRSEWIKLRNARARVGGAVMSSFISEDLRNLRAPEDTQSQWLRDRELARASKTQQTPKEAPVKLGCISGNCDSGFGEFASRDTTYTGTFENRRLEGYALITTSELQCEANMSSGFYDGIEHCVSIENGDHTFSEKTGRGLNGVQLIYSSAGELIEYSVYKRGVKQGIAFSSQQDKEQLASLELAYLLDELEALKQNEDEQMAAYKVGTLENIPVVRFETPIPTPKKNTPRSASQEVSPAAPLTKQTPQKPPKTKKAKQVRPVTVPDQNKKIGTKPEVKRPSIGEKRSGSAAKPKSNLQKLAYIAAELNSNRRQINYNYRLDKVRIDPNQFELVYEFTTMTPIRELDTSVIAVANQTAYCSSSKLKPFRDESMPARWLYIDSEGQKYEVLTEVSNCK